MATLWAAVITSIPAIFAVYFAWKVGRRQIEIASRQVDIAKRQTDVAQAAHELESQRVRAELYEKRSAVFGAARKFINSILLTGEVPGRRPDDSLGFQINQDFNEALGAAEFLFDHNVSNLMDMIHREAIDFFIEDSILGMPDVVSQERFRTEKRAEFVKLGRQLTEAVRPYLTIDGRGSLPRD